MGQTRVDLQHLLEDLRDAYPDAIEETILSEVVANALDSGASSVRVLTDPGERTIRARQAAAAAATAAFRRRARSRRIAGKREEHACVAASGHPRPQR